MPFSSGKVFGAEWRRPLERTNSGNFSFPRRISYYVTAEKMLNLLPSVWDVSCSVLRLRLIRSLIYGINGLCCVSFFQYGHQILFFMKSCVTLIETWCWMLYFVLLVKTASSGEHIYLNIALIVPVCIWGTVLVLQYFNFMLLYMSTPLFISQL